MLNIKVIICNSGSYDGTYFYKNARGLETENGVCYISVGKKQVIIPLNKIVRIEAEMVED